MKHPKSVATTSQTTVDQLSPPERRLLNILAWLAPEPVPLSLLEGNIVDGADARDALAGLASWSLARRIADGEGFTVHRLVQEITRQRLSDNEKQHSLESAVALLDRTLPSPDWDEKGWRLWEQLAPHCRTLLNCLRDHVLEPKATRIMNQLAGWLNNRAEYGEAEPLFRRALAIDEKSFGPDHPNVATGLNNLALLLQATGRLQEAEPLMRRALAIDEKSFGHVRRLREEKAEIDFEHNLTRRFTLRYFNCENVAIFEEVGWELQSNMNVLLGRNGYGKSLLLRAMAAILQRDDEISAELFTQNNQPGILSLSLIVTAHSPLVVGGCLDREVAVLRKASKEGFTLSQFQHDFMGWEVNDIYREVFDVEGRDDSYIHFNALAPKKDEIAKSIERLDDKSQRSSQEEEKLGELRDQLYYIRKAEVKLQERVRYEDLRRENEMLKAELKRLQTLRGRGLVE